MSFLQTMCIIMSLILSVLSFDSNITRQLPIDVVEPTGRMILWKEDEYIDVSDSLIFKPRDNKIDKVYVSYDEGKSYKLFVDDFEKEEFNISPKEAQNHVCIRFVTDGKYISKQFRINFIDCDTFTET